MSMFIAHLDEVYRFGEQFMKEIMNRGNQIS